jgi:hypothetical protein
VVWEAGYKNRQEPKVSKFNGPSSQSPFSSGLPSAKTPKKTLMQVSINNGIHWHGLVLATRIGTRLQEPLDVHFKDHKATYYTKDVRYINVKPITYTPDYMTGYGMKAIKSSRYLDLSEAHKGTF